MSLPDSPRQARGCAGLARASDVHPHVVQIRNDNLEDAHQDVRDGIVQLLVRGVQYQDQALLAISVLLAVHAVPTPLAQMRQNAESDVVAIAPNDLSLR